MKTNTAPIVVDVARDRLSLCTYANPQPFVFKFTSSMISDLEVVNHNELSQGIKGFIESTKLKSGQVVLILSESVYFEKDFAGPESPSQSSIDNFVETVPFSSTSSKLFKVGSGYKLVVVNRDLYEPLKKAFELNGFSVAAVVPGFVLGTANISPELTPESCRIIYRKIDQVILDSMIGMDEDNQSLHNQEQRFLEKNKVLVILLSVLFIGMAVVTAMITLKPVKKVTPRVVPVVQESVAAPTITPVPTSATIRPSADVIRALSVQVLNASGVSGQAASLSSRLKQLGFVDIKSANSSQNPGNTLVIVSPAAATSAGDFISQFVREIYPDYKLQQNSEAEFDITIIIGKSTH